MFADQCRLGWEASVPIYLKRKCSAHSVYNESETVFDFLPLEERHCSVLFCLVGPLS